MAGDAPVREICCFADFFQPQVSVKMEWAGIDYFKNDRIELVPMFGNRQWAGALVLKLSVKLHESTPSSIRPSPSPSIAAEKEFQLGENGSSSPLAKRRGLPWHTIEKQTTKRMEDY